MTKSRSILGQSTIDGALVFGFQLLLIVVIPFCGYCQPQSRRAGITRAPQSQVRESGESHAVTMARIALADAETRYGLNAAETGTAAAELGVLYKERGDFRSAESFFKRALNIRRKHFGPRHNVTAVALISLSALYHAMGDNQRAEPLLRNALTIQETLNGQDSPWLVPALTNVAEMLRLRGAYSEAESFDLRALAIANATGEPFGHEPSVILNHLGRIYLDQHALEKAFSMLTRALTSTRDEFGAEHPRTAIAISEVANVQTLLRHYDEAIRQYEQALQIAEGALGADHPDTITIIGMLAFACEEKGEYARAEGLISRILARHDEQFGPEHAGTADALLQLASINESRGSFERAEAFARRALLIRQKVLGRDRLEVAEALNTLASILDGKGVLDGAEAFFREALEIRERRLGPDSPSTAATLDNLGYVYQERDAFKKAIPLHERALRIFKALPDPENHDVVIAMDNLAAAYEGLRDFARAQDLYEQALQVTRRLRSDSHPDTALAHNNLGAVLLKRHQYALADYHFALALSVFTAVLGEQHPRTATVLANLARLNHEQKNYEEADRLYRKALATLKNTTGLDNSVGLAITRSFAGSLMEGGGDEARRDCLGLMHHILQSRYLRNVVLFGQQIERQATLTRHLQDISLLASNVSSFSDDAPALRSVLMQLILLAKGRNQDELRAAIQAVQTGTNPELKRNAQELRSTWYRLSRAESLDERGSRTGVAERRALAAHAEELLDKISNADPKIRKIRDREDATSLEGIAKQLRSGEALVEVVRFPRWRANDQASEDTAASYGAAVLHAYADTDTLRIDWVDLGGARDLETVISQYLQSVRVAANRSLTDVARSKLRQMIWARLTTAAGNKSRWIISPGSQTRLIPWTILPGLRTETEVVLTTSGRDVARWAVPTQVKGPDIVAGASTFGTPRKAAKITFDDLPGVPREIQTIARLLGVPSGNSSTAITRRWLLDHVRRPRIFHLATHGFFDNSTSASEDILSHVGVALAGANEGPQGIFTARELINLSLGGTELAVISACESAAGHSRFTEGLLGLQWALVVAGVKSQLLTLWPVNDQKTREFMEEFYTKLMQGHSKVSALRAAQRALIDRGDPENAWAGFVLYGDPSPITLD